MYKSSSSSNYLLHPFHFHFHFHFQVADVDYLRVIFHVEGTKRSGVVSCDLKKSKNGWKTRYEAVHFLLSCYKSMVIVGVLQLNV